jgi:Gpi18-like mannosyltransferase
MPERVRTWLRSGELRESAGVWLLTRAFFLLLTYFGIILLNSQFHDASHPSFLHRLLPAWHQWDAWWYTNIAARGYTWHRGITSPAAFFPLFPLLIRVAVEVTHRSYELSALIVSNIAFLAALVYLWRLTRDELGHETAGRAILYVAVFPTALFFFAGYTESLFLFLSVASFYHLRRGDWITSGTFGALASATRVTGVLLVLPFAYEYFSARGFSLRRIDWRFIGLLLIPAGLLAFMLYLYAVTGDALAFTHSQVGWQKVFTLRLWAGILESMRQIVEGQPQASFFQAHNVLNLGIGLLFLIWSVYSARRLPRSYGLYMLAFWLVTLTSPAIAGGYPVPLVSLDRYVLALFPVFMYAGWLGRRRGFHDAYVVISTGLLALLTILFINARWVV